MRYLPMCVGSTTPLPEEASATGGADWLRTEDMKWGGKGSHSCIGDVDEVRQHGADSALFTFADELRRAARKQNLAS